MSLPRNKFRELVFQILYRNHFLKEEESSDLSFYMSALKTTKANVLEAKRVAQNILDKLEELDLLIDQASIGYDFDRIQSVEICALRLALYEMRCDETLPDLVAIKEALRLTKKFSTSDAVTFVNGVLDQLYKNTTNPVYTA